MLAAILALFALISAGPTATNIITNLAANFGATKPAVAESTSCRDLEFIFARGSGGALVDDDNYLAYKDAFDTALQDSTLDYDYYLLGSAAHGGYKYPAAGIGIDSIERFTTAAGALVSAGESYEYGRSVDAGVEELVAYLAEQQVACPDTEFILSGYSQGAQVISEALPRLNSDQIFYAATFGDPKLYLPEGYRATSSDTPQACQGTGLSSYRAFVPDCYVYEGILGGLQPYQTSELAGRVGAWCNHKDVMCGSEFDLENFISAHSDYKNTGYKDAASTIATLLLAEFPDKIKTADTTAITSTHDTAIIIDTTGSMSSLIDTYKAEAKKLARETLDKGGRIALYEYRDLSDPFETVQHCDFGCSYETFEAELDQLTVDGGGDDDESALSASLHVMDDLKWEVGATKSIVLLTDAGYHITDVDGTTLADVTKRSLEIDPVNIYVIAPEQLRATYAELTASTNGQFFSSADDLAASTSYIMTRPTAVLPLDIYRGTPGSTITFDASASTASNPIDHYEWDLDFDGVFETTTTAPHASHTYATATSGFMQVKVVDTAGLSSTMSAQVIIADQSAASPNITNLRLVKQTDTTATLEFSATDTVAALLLINDAPAAILTNDGKPSDGSTIELTDLSGDTTVTLIPFSTDGFRGASQTLTIYTPGAGGLSATSGTLSSPALKAPNAGAKSPRRQ